MILYINSQNGCSILPKVYESNKKNYKICIKNNTLHLRVSVSRKAEYKNVERLFFSKYNKDGVYTCIESYLIFFKFMDAIKSLN